MNQHIGRRVYVYWNLQKDVWSVRAEDGAEAGRILFHAEHLTLEGCMFKVSETTRRKILVTKRRRIHAGIVGRVAPTRDARPDAVRVSYNPYKGPSFYARDTGAAISQSASVIFKGFDALAEI